MTEIKWWKAKGCTCPGDECSHCATSEAHLRDAEGAIGVVYGEHCTGCGYMERWMRNSDGTRTVMDSSGDTSINIGDHATWKTVLG